MYIYKTVIILIISCFTGTIGIAQETSAISFDKEEIKAIVVANVNGSVILQSDNNKSPVLSIKKITDGGQRIISSIEHIIHNDTLIIYLESPCTELNISNNSRYLSGPWDVYNWNNKNECSEFLSTIYNLTLQVPDEIPVTLSTINNGNISVTGYKGNLNAQNVNGSVILNDVLNVISAKTVNGDIDIHFSSNPETNGTFYTLNGEINAYYLPDVNIDLTFKTFMGDFYTDAENIKTLPGGVTQVKESKGFKVKVRDQSLMRIGKGGFVQSFETFNGDAIVRINTKS